MNKRKAWDIISKFIYDSLMDNDRKFKAQEAANLLYKDDEQNTKRVRNTMLITQSPKTLHLERRLKSK